MFIIKDLLEILHIQNAHNQIEQQFNLMLLQSTLNIQYIIYYINNHLQKEKKGMNDFQQSQKSLRNKILDKHEQNRKSQRTKLITVILITLAIFLIIGLPNLSRQINQSIRQNQLYMLTNKTVQQQQNHHLHLIKQYLDIKSVPPSFPKVDKNNKFVERFSVNGREIQYNGPSQKWTQIIAYKPIPYNETYKLKYLVSFSTNRHIMLGITNHQTINEQSSFFNLDTYAYYGYNGCLWAEGKLLKRDHRGYKEKDVVEIDIQLSQGVIQWKVNSEVRAQVYSDNLKSKDKHFVPYLQMFEKQDSLRLID